jgi:beta-lactamase regulating signal transducer with metallopeptidase domain
MHIMFLHDPLSAASNWMTYFVQISLGYLVTWGLCRLIHNPRIRLRLWGSFLLFTVGGWILACLPPTVTSSAALSTVPLHVPVAPPLTGVWAVEAAWAPHLSWLGAWIGWLYLSIFAVLVLQLWVKSVGLRAFLRNGRTPSGELQLLFENICAEMGIPGCSLTLLPELPSPATACWWRPRVLLPVELVPQLDNRQLADILRHELTHVRRRDYLWDRLAALGCRLVFFHPVAWMAHRRLRQERELACDLAVVESRADGRLQYAECLAKLARWYFLTRKKSPGAIGFASSASLLATRVRAILREPSPYSAPRLTIRASVMILAAAMAACLLPGVGISLYWSPPSRSIAEKVVSKIAAVKQNRVHVRKPAQKRMGAEPATEAEYTARPSEPTSPPSGLFSDLSSRSLPVLVESRAGSDTNGDTRSRRDPSDRIGAVNSQPAWDEGPMPRPLARSPNWRSVTIDAIRAGVALGRGGNSEGEDGEAGNH